MEVSDRRRDALERVFGGARPLRLPEAVFDAVLEGWRLQQASRHLEPGTVKQRIDLVRRAVRHLGEWPWEWTPLAVEEFIVDVAGRGLARSTIRTHQGTLKVFLDYLCDPRYPWMEICEHELGRTPRQVFDNQNLTRHLAELEGDPQNRPLTRSELERFFAFCDEQVAAKQRRHRKGALAAFRDAVLFKVIYAWGLAPWGSGDARRRRFRTEPDRPRVWSVRIGTRPLREGIERKWPTIPDGVDRF